MGELEEFNSNFLWNLQIMIDYTKPRILVFGVGGAGGNAVDNMMASGLQGVEFVVSNTDNQALERSKTKDRIQLGPKTSSGLGAGARPEIGEQAAEESLDIIRQRLEGANMVFVAAGMGGGTGTGASPIIAREARSMDILTVGVVTKPFGFEGTRRMAAAEEGLSALEATVDTLIVVPNQNLFLIADEKTTFAEAFRLADEVLYQGVRSITDLMVNPGMINLDFADVRSIMSNMGSSMMGMGEASGETRAIDAADAAIKNPLLEQVEMAGAQAVLINMTGGYDMTLFEVDQAANKVRDEVDPNANIIVGTTYDTEMNGRFRVSVVAAGVFNAKSIAKPITTPKKEVNVVKPVIVTNVSEVQETSDQIEDTIEDNDDHVEPEDYHIEQEEESEIESPPPSRPYFGAETTSRTETEKEPTPPPRIVTEPEPEPVAPPPVEGGSGFGNLFGWGKKKPGLGARSQAEVNQAASDRNSSKNDGSTKSAPFNDNDLEIPAFLRRSANN